MATGADGPPMVPLPTRIDRRLRLGPFPSARDALKFLGYAATAAVLVPIVTVAGALLLAGAGLLAATWRPDGASWDERAVALLRWRLRRAWGSRGAMTFARSPLARDGYFQLADGDRVAIVRTGGTPIAYLPPAELAVRFERFRELLHTGSGRLAFWVGGDAIRAAPFSPPAHSSAEDAAAEDGYRRLVELLTRRRHARRVYLAWTLPETGSEGIARLESEVAALLERLTALGLRPIRLKDRRLAEAAHRFGWSAPEDEA